MNKYTFIVGILLTLIAVILGVFYAIMEGMTSGSLSLEYRNYLNIMYVAMIVGTVLIIVGLFAKFGTKEVFGRVKITYTKPVFVLIIMIVNGVATYSGTLVNYFIHNQQLAVATSVFLGVVFNSLVTYLSTEEQTAPNIKDPPQPEPTEGTTIYSGNMVITNQSH